MQTNSYGSITKELAEDFSKYEEEAFAEALLGVKTKQMRTIPVNVGIEPESCAACGECKEICQMDALISENNHTEVLRSHCIGCGNCLKDRQSSGTLSFAYIRTGTRRARSAT